MKRNIMKRAHELARTIEGDYRARMSLALRQAWKEEKEGNKVENTRLQEIIKKYGLWIDAKGQIWGSKVNKKDAEELRDRKTELIEELKRQRAEKEAARQAEHKAKEQKKQDIIDGKIKIKVRFHDGEYLSGWEVDDWDAAQLLKEIGFAKEIQGWGYKVSDEAIEKLGKEFTYSEAVEFMRPVNEAKAARIAEKEAERAARFAEAKATGKPVVLRRWSEECNDPNEDCSIDNLTEYAMPDGTTKVERHHTW